MVGTSVIGTLIAESNFVKILELTIVAVVAEACVAGLVNAWYGCQQKDGVVKRIPREQRIV